MVLSAPSNRDTAKLSTALMYGGSFTVLSVASTPGSRNMRIRSCVNSPLNSLFFDEGEEVLILRIVGA